MSIAMIRELWGYHHWANRRLLDVAAALGEEAAGREMGAHFSAPSLREMFVHLYGADRFWLRHWTGEPPAPPVPPMGSTSRRSLSCGGAGTSWSPSSGASSTA